MTSSARSAARPAAVATAIVAAASLYLLLETVRNHADVPYWDAWELVPLIRLQHDGALTFSALVAQHNEHRPLFPRLLLLAFARLTDWDQTYERVLTLAMPVVSLLGLTALVRRTVSREAPSGRLTGFVLVGVMTLSLNQWENWFRSWHVAVLMNVAAMIVGVWLLSARRRVDAGFVGAAVAGVVATYSLANGLLFWLVTLPFLRGRGLRRQLVWGAVAVGAIGAYFMGFHVLDAGRAPDLQAGGRQMLRTLGAPLANHAGAPAVLATGAVGLALLLLRLRRSWGRLGWRTLDSPWLAIGAYGLCSAALVGLGRQIPSDEVIPSKYATSVSPFWIGLALMYLESERRLAFAWLLVPALATVTAVQARPTYQAATRTIQSARSALFAPVDNPLLGRLYPDPTRPERDVATLRELGLSIYRCACPLSRADWTAAAGILAMRARPDDLLIATNDWNAGCLSDQLVRLERALRLVSVDESQEAARAQLDGVTDAFVLTGGDVHGNDAKDWLERRSVPLYRSPNGAMRLLYYPDRAHYVRTRLTPSEIQADHDRFRSLDDLIAPVASPFLLGGWTSGGVSEFGGTRRMFDRQASIYVPVVDDAPRTLRVGVTLVDARVVGGRLEIWVNEARLASMHLAAEPVVQEVSLAGAGWEYGGNVVSLRAPALDRPADDTSPLLAFDRLKLSY